MIKRIPHLAALLLFCIVPLASAWDSAGHRVISAIAYTHLAPAAQRKIDQLTEVKPKSSPSYMHSHAEHGNEQNQKYSPLSRFLYLSTLPDQWRHADGGQSGSWHFIDLPWSADGTPALPAPAPNLLTRLAQFQSALQNPDTPLVEQATALAYVVHLTEDAHQPLHCINRFSRDFPRGDKGGNLFPIQDPHANNLHQYWDRSVRRILLTHSLRKEKAKSNYLSTRQIIKLAKQIEAAYPEPALEDLSAQHWVEESNSIAQEKVYAIRPGEAPSAAYQQMQREVAARQMALAGYRLAALLNRLLPGDSAHGKKR